MEKLYSISEVADKLGLSTKTLRRWEETGKFKGSRTLGGQRRYTVTDLQILDAIKHGTIPGSSDLLTIDQAAELFGVTPTTIVRWEDSGKIHPLITAGVTYYPRHRLLENREMLKSLTPYQEPVFQPVAIPEHSNLYKVKNITNTPTTQLPAQQPVMTTKKPHIQLPQISTSNGLHIVIINAVLTLTLLTAYHLLFATQPLPSPSSSNQGSVQGVSDSHNAVLSILDSIIDVNGNLRAQSVTTPKLSLSPGAPPSKAIPGSLYFDAGSQTVKVYVNGTWRVLAYRENVATSSALPSATPSATVKNQSIR